MKVREGVGGRDEDDEDDEAEGGWEDDEDESKAVLSGCGMGSERRRETEVDERDGP